MDGRDVSALCGEASARRAALVNALAPEKARVCAAPAAPRQICKKIGVLTRKPLHVPRLCSETYYALHAKKPSFISL